MRFDWNKIKDKYPLSYYKFSDKDYRRVLASFESVYSVLEKFFENNNIYISIYKCFNQGRKKTWIFSWKIRTINIDESYPRQTNLWIKEIDLDSAKIMSIYKAFEILENTLNKEVNYGLR
jgi:hypothetical protein